MKKHKCSQKKRNRLRVVFAMLDGGQFNRKIWLLQHGKIV